MTFEDYKLKYPNSPLKSDSTKSQSKVTLENMIRIHGEIEGLEAFNRYRQRQAYSNSLEYKQLHHGWTEEQYKQYNASRANTKNNCIKRHGKELGELKWNAYCDVQRYVGVSYDYFVSKYGDIEGPERYEKMLDKKAHSNFPGYSKVSAELFSLIDTDGNGFYAPKTPEYKFKTAALTRRSYFIDFYNPVQRKGIEFYGDYWHTNPEKYQLDFKNRSGRTAEEQWTFDKNRINSIEQEFNIKILVIWENDFKMNREEVIRKSRAFIYGS